MDENFLEFIELLNKHEVKYVLIGGWAVIFYGYERTTGDMDIFIERTEENAEKVLNALRDFWGSTIGFTKEDLLDEDEICHMGQKPLRIDILNSIPGVTFKEVYATSNFYEDSGVRIRCIHINELIENKKASGRLKDLADAEKLEKILKKRNKDK